ncbi:sulfite exporter TauE/SafE family protein [Gracilibacillus sp. S3-1-1]|uniref:Sulfite exporter TauE/SafE family protein n=1 Tax=Gracilibacillus pellucidus TaxID=3095368 RepID=A0ACC6M3K3_9BACI|nr:sulfite exporter TauE/SafE family protein [Gracilibacillus sp. S3-1-1]MDX8045539.1 sulfite exporter TauE/SafE family protein [Gracilibacillus sp. S3-1-1]
MIIIYFIVGLFASILGSIAGLGGGVIIKPILDLLGHFDLATIGILSAATVLSMATVSLIQYGTNKDVKIDKTTSPIIAIGSIIGGSSGKALFNLLTLSVNIPTVTAIIQSAVLATLLLLIYIYFKRKHRLNTFVLQNKWIILGVGFLLGLLSAFLGIGGGPINVAILSLLFSMNTKDAAINSIFIIFFSQLSALILIAFTTGYGNADLSMLYFMIPGGILGGMIGSAMVTKLTNMHVEKIFNISVLLMVCINLYNILQAAMS